VTGLGREDFAQVIAKRGWWSGSLLYQRRDGSEFLLQATGVRVPLERGAGTLWLSHLPGKDSDQQALGEALALADVERRRLTMIAEAGKLNHGLERSKRKRRRRAARQHNYAASARPPLPDHRKGPSRQRPAPRRRREGTQFSYPTAAPRSGA
jgi:hypothetical protein